MNMGAYTSLLTLAFKCYLFVNAAGVALIIGAVVYLWWTHEPCQECAESRGPRDGYYSGPIPHD